MSKSSTISEEISQTLADEIVTGRIAPGQKLDERRIAARFEVSRTPVRDALRQLATTGLIEFRAHRGATVVDIGVEQLTDMFDAMGELEALCAKLSAQRMSAVERKKLETLHYQSTEVVDSEDDTAYSALNERYHETIFDGTHNKSIRDITLNFRRRLAPFRASVFFRNRDRMRSSFNEHDEITNAILSADADRAYQAMRQHVASSSLNVIEYLMRSRTEATLPGGGDQAPST